MGEKRNVWLPVVLMVVFAITRWPWEINHERVLPPNFSGAYALVFCAGIYFRNRLGSWIPLSVMLLTDVALNVFYYTPRGWGGWKTLGYQAMNCIAYAAIFWLSRRFKQKDSFVKTVCGGLAGGIIFYLITNTAAWLVR